MESQGFEIFLLFLFLAESTRSSGPLLEEQNSKSYYCREQIDHHRMSLNCSHQNLTYIPRTKNYIKNLIFSYNDLTNVTSVTFGNISNPANLVDLELDHNHIQNISSDAFATFPNLKYLYLSYNPIYYSNMKDLLGALSNFHNLYHLELSGITTVKIQKDLFSLMGENHIETLSLKDSSIKKLAMDSFKPFNSLKSLYLRDNLIEELSLFKHTNLYSLYLDHNRLKSFPDFCTEQNRSDCYFRKLEILNIQNNRISELRPDNLQCLPNLKCLKVGENPITVLCDNLLSQLPKIHYLRLRNLNRDALKVRPFAFNSTSLTMLHLGFGGPAKSIFTSFKDTFRLLPHLRYLVLGHTGMLQLTSEQSSELFSPLIILKSFHCFSCQIAQDPKIILNQMKHLVNISLQSNLLTKLSDETFKENKHLRSLSLRYNEIGHIDESALPTSLLNRLYQLDLSQNPFFCDCGLEWFINWMKINRNRKVILRYPQEYVCSLPKEKSTMRLSDISFTYKECHPWSPWIWVAIIASPCVIVIGITVIILYRNRWNIKHYIYLLRKRRNYQVINGNNFVYDAFVAYEAEDSAWVRRRLLPVLEGQMGLTLCIHERDFQPGAFINDNIVTNIDKSEKILLVLTNGFARSEWCMFELKVAHSKLIKDETELLVILLEKIDGRNMNHSLKLLFDTTTYIEWTEDIVGQELFWEKLKNALKK
ncbi:toll-like receptor 13 [Mercenaria mercenaria]|uniref:toll-like receptor 13 n=1 Tax=Mercenaria mercenaria TaxID=6596 RepID=UPI00234EF683|nr:toll-like receptor 13 [Mercenaria mercenaria]